MAETIVTSLPAFVPKLEEVLRLELPGAEITHEHIRGNRYRFIVVWDKFSGVGHPERQRKVWDLATATVDQRDLFDVGMILTIAPEELPQE